MSHETDSPYLTPQGPKARADFDVVLLQESLSDLGLIKTGGDFYRCQTREPVRRENVEFEPEGSEAAVKRQSGPAVPFETVLQPLFQER